MTKRLKGIPNLPFAPIVAALFGVVAAILVFATPAWLLERTVGTLGISSFVAAAKPPLGDTARALIALATGLATFVALWMIMRPIERLIHNRRTAARFAKAVKPAPAPVVQEGDRAPIFAGQELGAPLMSDEALASGEELFLDSAMVEAPETLTSPEIEAAPAPAAAFEPDALDLSAFAPVDDRAHELKPRDAVWPEPEQPARVELAWSEQAFDPATAAEVKDDQSSGSIEFLTVDDDSAPLVDASSFSAAQVAPSEEPAPVALSWPTNSPVEDPSPVAPLELAWPEPSVEPMPAVEAKESQSGGSIEFETASEEPAPVALSWPIAEPVEETVPMAFSRPNSDPAPAVPATAEPSLAHATVITAETEPSLQDLLRRFETALDHRRTLAAEGADLSEPPAFGTVASLRDLIESSNKNAA